MIRAHSSRSYLLGSCPVNGAVYTARRYGSFWSIEDSNGATHGTRYASLRACRAIAARDLI